MKNLMTFPLKQLHLLVMVLCISVFTACEEDEGEEDQTDTRVSSQDENFAREATYFNKAELDLGNLAVAKADTPDVMDYAEVMLLDHMGAQSSLEGIALAVGISLPDTTSNEDQAVYEQLAALSGSAFDTAYIQQQIEAHEEARDLFQRQIDEGQNTDLKDYASSIMPDINTHLERARELAGE